MKRTSLITLITAALLTFGTLAVADVANDQEFASTQTSTSQIKEQPKLGYCWVNLGGRWIWIC